MGFPIVHRSYNMVSFKLKQHRLVNPREMWIRAEGVYPAIVDKALFLRAREIVDARSQYFTDAELLEALRAVLKQKGVLSGLIIDEQKTTVFQCRPEPLR